MCARAVSVAVGRIDGVESVEVSLNEGLAVVTFAPGNTASLEQIRTAIRQNGFTPKDAVVRIRGTIVRATQTTYLALPGSDVRFVLDGAEPSAANGPAEIEGVVPETGNDTPSPWRLTVRRLRAIP